MSKKISFKRPEKPIPQAADDWVAAKPDAEEPPEPAAEPEPVAEVQAETPKRKRKPAKKQPVAAPPIMASPPDRRGGAALSDARWIERMLASLERQTDLMTRKAAALPQNGEAAGGASLALLYEQMDARTRSVIERLDALRAALGSDRD